MTEVTYHTLIILVNYLAIITIQQQAFPGGSDSKEAGDPSHLHDCRTQQISLFLKIL